jgi:hypothetical protein
MTYPPADPSVPDVPAGAADPLPGLEPVTHPGPHPDDIIGAPAGDTVAAHQAKANRRPADTIWRANPREQGLLGVVDAIAHFGGRGWSVSMPLIDSQPYDLVVDDGDRLYRVQVKTTTFRSPYGVYVVLLATRGGNQSFHTSKDFDPAASDLLYVLTDDRERYVLPTSIIRSRTRLNLGRRVDRYRVT